MAQEINSRVIIREGQAEDLEGIALLETQCFTAPWSREALAHDMAENEMSRYLVAELEGEIAGYMGFWIIVNEAHVNNVAVSPEHRRLHIGSTIIDAFIRFCDEKKLEGETLEVRVSNSAAIGLYAKFGFKEAGIRPGYYENGEDAVIMWRNQE